MPPTVFSANRGRVAPQPAWRHSASQPPPGESAPHSSDLRLHRISQPFGLYFITKCLSRGAVFSETQRADVCGAFQHFRNRRCLFLQAFVVMPDHWHALFLLGDLLRLDTLIQKLNSWASFPTRQAGGKIAWQDEYRDTLIKADESVVDVVGYIEANPVRKGWVSNASEWRWSSAHAEFQGRLDRDHLTIKSWDRRG